MFAARIFHPHSLAISSLLCLLTGATLAQQAGSPRDEAVLGHAHAFETAGESATEDLLADFERRLTAEFMAETTREQRLSLLLNIHEAASAARGAMIGEADGAIRLTLMADPPLEIEFRVEDQPPYAIRSLHIAQSEAIGLTWDNVATKFDELEAGGFSGVAHIMRDGIIELQQAYGDSNRELGYRTRLNTVYGIGSTPIDFTVAGVLLLAQQGKLSLHDTVDKYFDEVPADKRSLTINHLISGQSGLPDFHDTDSDWDADLAWIDRDTAVQRILGQPLLFAPGENNAHSHSAYGLVAAIIELVSGKSYFDFISEAFFRPAGMQRTGMYGDDRGLSLRDFAVGYGPSSVGVPNIPPNWGPTSWLVLGSGGMYSTLGDMLKFYRFVQSGEVLQNEYAERMSGETVAIGGSNRGFYFFYASNGKGNAAMLLMNGEGRRPEIQAMSRALEGLVM